MGGATQILAPPASIRDGLAVNGRRRRFIKRKVEFVVAVQLDLITEGSTYYKWGGMQHASVATGS